MLGERASLPAQDVPSNLLLLRLSCSALACLLLGLALGAIIATQFANGPSAHTGSSYLDSMSWQLIAGRLYTGLSYRLNDVVLLHGNTKHAPTFRYHRLINNSIAAAYMASASKGMDLVTLRKVSEDAARDTCVVHLRIGDVLDRSDWTLSKGRPAGYRGEDLATILHTGYNGDDAPKGTHGVYGHSLAAYQACFPELRAAGVRIVVLVAGSHTALGSYRVSAMYIQALARLFEAAGFSAHLRLGQHPDDDFMYMTSSRCFVQGGGGFSQLVARMIIARHGVVINPWNLGNNTRRHAHLVARRVHLPGRVNRSS